MDAMLSSTRERNESAAPSPTSRRPALLREATAFRVLPNPLGCFVLIQHARDRLASTWLPEKDADGLPAAEGDAARLDDLADRMRRYFAGDDVDFTDVPLPPATPFLTRCWRAAQRIPRGRTISYAQLAVAAGSSPGAARSAGQAMRRNPLGIIIPCHRVIAADHRLGGFGGSTDPAGSALRMKVRLLAFEGVRLGPDGRVGVD